MRAKKARRTSASNTSNKCGRTCGRSACASGWNRVMTPTSEAHADHAGAVSPRTDTEKVLADIWAKILERPQIGIFDDFIALGGDSMYALQVINRIRTQFSVQVALDQFFVEPAHV